jgi:CRP-like cAMP-binding protein
VKDLIHLLSESGFFAGLSYESRRKLADIAAIKYVGKGEAVFHENQLGDAFYLLVRGQVRLHKTANDGREAVIKIVGPGETFAEVVLFEVHRYPVTAVALSPATLLRFLKADIHRLLDNRDFRNNFIAMLMRKQRYLAERIRDSVTQSLDQQLLRFLTSQFGPGPRIEVPISKKHIAAALGIAPETLSRVIRRLTTRGMLRWRRRIVTICSKAHV